MRSKSNFARADRPRAPASRERGGSGEDLPQRERRRGDVLSLEEALQRDTYGEVSDFNMLVEEAASHARNYLLTRNRRELIDQ